MIDDKGLKHLLSLKTLDLNFESCERIGSKGLESLSLALQNCTFLANLSLNFSSTGVSNYSVKSFSSGLTALKSLLSFLKLSFKRFIFIDDDGVEGFALQLPHFSSLTTLYLNFNECVKISSEGIQALSVGFSQVSSLVSLTISFQNCTNINNKGLEDLFSNLEPCISLTKLSLNFAPCKSIGDQ